MKKRAWTLVALLIVAGSIRLSGQAKGGPLTLTLQDCILRAMKNNLSVAIEILNPRISAAALTRAGEKFYPTLGMSLMRRSTNTAAYSFLDASSASVGTKYNDYSVDVSQSLPGGGSLAVTFDNNKNNTTQSYQTINPRYGSTLTFNFTQPLLKDFGWNTSRQDILLARNNLAISESQLELQLMTTIYSVEQAYWNLVYSIDNLDVSRQSLQLAKDLLEKNKRSVEVGQMAPIDVLSAQAEVAIREADIIQAEAQVKNDEDQLKTILNISDEEKKAISSIVPADKPSAEPREITAEQAMVTAIENRPELQSSRITLKNEELNLSYAKNQLLPALNLTTQYWSPGISGTRILYLNDNALTGVIVGTIPGGSSQAIKDATKFKYQNWSFGLTLDIPISSVVSRAAVTQARLNVDQAVLSVKNQEQQITLEITTAVRAVETNYKRILAYKVARELAEQKLAAETEKLKVGLSTNYLVLQNQRDLATARTSELKAIVDYSLSLASLDKALGVSIKNQNIKITDSPMND
jgi:outer membrane protein TolC